MLKIRTFACTNVHSVTDVCVVLSAAHEMLKVQMRKFEGDLVDKNAASNALSVKVASLEKENACLLEDKGMLKGDLLRTKEYISTLQEMIKKLNGRIST